LCVVRDMEMISVAGMPASSVALAGVFIMGDINCGSHVEKE
jgi:hypothetical protein